MEESKVIIDLKQFKSENSNNQIHPKNLKDIKEIVLTTNRFFFMSKLSAIEFNLETKKYHILNLLKNKKSKILNLKSQNKPNYFNKKILCTPAGKSGNEEIYDCIIDPKLRKRVDTGRGMRSIRLCQVFKQFNFLEIWNYNRFQMNFGKTEKDCLSIVEGNTQKFLLRKNLNKFGGEMKIHIRLDLFFLEFYDWTKTGKYILSDVGQKYFYFNLLSTRFGSSIIFTLRPKMRHMLIEDIHKGKKVYSEAEFLNFLKTIENFNPEKFKKFCLNTVKYVYFFSRNDKDYFLIVLKGKKKGESVEFKESNKPKPYMYLVINISKKEDEEKLDFKLVKMSKIFEEKLDIRLMDRVEYSKGSRDEIFLKILGVELNFPDFEVKADIAFFDDNFDLCYLFKSVSPESKIIVKKGVCEFYWGDVEDFSVKRIQASFE